MMDLSGIKEIQVRIAEIEGQFALSKQQLPGMDFAAKLQQEINKDAVSAAHKAKPAQRVQGTAAAEKTVAAEPVNYANPQLTHMIHEAAAKYAVDPKLVSAVAEVESGGNQNAVSSAGAIGVMQLMPDTAAELGVNPYDMKSNVEGGAKYLREMLDTFDGDVKKAVAAYNAGPNAVKAYGGVPPYAQTQNYVTNVLDIYR